MGCFVWISLRRAIETFRLGAGVVGLSGKEVIGASVESVGSVERIPDGAWRWYVWKFGRSNLDGDRGGMGTGDEDVSPMKRDTSSPIDTDSSWGQLTWTQEKNKEWTQRTDIRWYKDTMKNRRVVPISLLGSRISEKDTFYGSWGQLIINRSRLMDKISAPKNSWR